MLSGMAHIGVTVSDLDTSVAFYRDVVGLDYVGEMSMGGPETAALFQRENCTARVAYLRCPRDWQGPLLELICFTDQAAEKMPADLFRTSISEICFQAPDIDAEYRRLLAAGVDFLSPPQTFDSTKFGFGRSRAVYFRDPDQLIMELIQPLSE